MRKYTLNENYFESVDTQEKAYFLGYLMADGYNNQKRNVIELSCSKKDVEILEGLNHLIGSNKPIRFVKSKGIESYRIDWCSRKLCDDLASLGCVQAKTFKLKFPKIRCDLVRHFIRGYFDGDGCISFSYSAMDNCFGNHFASVITIVSTLDFCNYLKEYFMENLQLKSTICCRHPENNNNNRTLHISGNNKVVRLMEWMYRDSFVFLKRKREKFDEIRRILSDRKIEYSKIRGNSKP